MAATLKQQVGNSNCIPEEGNVKETTSEYNGLVWPITFAEAHPTKQLLDTYAKQGCPVDCSED
eukprot:3533326-Ditylum_brightwellii.AAC.1